jgi:glutaredoxin
MPLVDFLRDHHKWKDKDGNIIFSETPPPLGINAEIKEFKEESTERPKTKEYFPKSTRERVEEKRPYRDIHVIMYMTFWCPDCLKAREYLRSLDVHLIEYNIERDKSKSGGSTGVPLIDVEGIIIRGYNLSALRAAIERRRSL